MRIASFIRLGLVALLVCVVPALIPASARADTRVALVIGNSAYAHGGRLSNPANDAALVAQALRKVGFTVVSQSDLGKTQLEDALQSFTRAATGADVALIYYAGHGIEKGGVNYVVPVDATLAADTDVDFEAVPLDLIMHSVGGATRLKIVILDACRNNPFRDAMRRSAGTRGIGQGLAKPPDPEEGDMLVAYAAAAGSTAEDGGGANSPFATALAKHLTDPGIDIRIMFGKIRDDVQVATNHQQEPAVYESLGGEQFLMSAATASGGGAAAVASTATSPPDPKTMELAFWQSVENSNDVTQLNAYLTQYPNGAFASLAKDKIAALNQSTQVAANAPTDRTFAQDASAPAAASQPQTGPGAQSGYNPYAGQGLAAGSVPGPGPGPGAGAGWGPRMGPLDGAWVVRQTCPDANGGGSPITSKFFGLVRNYTFHAARGTPGMPGWLALDGTIGPRGEAVLDVHGVNARTRFEPAPGAPEMEFHHLLRVHFGPAGAVGQWMASRGCLFAIARQ
jgi:hypothetical protein